MNESYPYMCEWQLKFNAKCLFNKVNPFEGGFKCHL